MKRLVLTWIFCGMFSISKAQVASVERSTLGFQTGFLGFWVHNEAKIKPQLVLRSELGLDIDYIEPV